MNTSRATRITTYFIFIAITAFALFFAYDHAYHDRENSSTLKSPKMIWQTYCSVEQLPTPRKGKIKVERLGRPSEKIHSAHLFVHEDRLIAWDIPNHEQFVMSGSSFEQIESVDCPSFKANGWNFKYGDGKSTACKDGLCLSIDVKDRTLPFVYAESNGAVFVGTSFGDALLFKNGKWCRMEKRKLRFSCNGLLPPPSEPSTQFYSSAYFNGRTLVGEYPSGAIFEFDGKEVFPSKISPAEFPHSGRISYESQTLMSFCGSFLVGYWPKGEIYTYSGEWQEPIALFSPNEDYVAFQDEAVSSDLVANFFGRRVASLVQYDDALYAITSSKGDWHTGIDTNLSKADADEYGMVWKLTCT